MIKLKEILNPKKKLNEGGEKTYLSLMKVEKEINKLEKIFKYLHKNLKVIKKQLHLDNLYQLMLEQ